MAPPDDCGWLADCLNQSGANRGDCYDDSHWSAVPIGWPIRNWLFGIQAHKWRTPKAKNWVGSGIRRLKNQIRCHCIRHCDTAKLQLKLRQSTTFTPSLWCLTKNYLNNCVNKRLLLFITNALFSSFIKFAWQLFHLSNTNSNLHRLDLNHLLFPRIWKQRGRGKKQRKTSRHMW